MIENSSFEVISKAAEKKHKFDKAALSLEKGFNKSVLKDYNSVYSPKMTEECEEKPKSRFNLEDLRIYSNTFNLLFFKSPVKLYVCSGTSQFEFLKKKAFYSMECQTKLLSVLSTLIKSEIDKIFSLNEEYNNQLVSNRLETQQLKRFYEDQIQSYQEEVANCKSFDMLQPEMIPPEQTIKIFLCMSKFKSVWDRKSVV